MKQETISKAQAAQLFAENAVLFGRSGIILEREGLPYTVSFGDGKCGAIYIKKEKLEGSF